jgi:hypothetical protein
MPINITEERFEALREKTTEALRRGEHVLSALSTEELQELKQGFPTFIQIAEDKMAQAKVRLDEIKAANQKRQEEFRKFIREQAEQDGVDIPDAAVEDLSVTGYAIRCQFYFVACGDNAVAQEYWANNLKKWFARPGFDLSEFNRLCAHYGITVDA